MGESYSINVRRLDGYDVIVCGGGLAGVAAAVNAAKNGANTLLVESGGVLGGDITQSVVPNILDQDGKGGIVKDLFSFLNGGEHTVARRGNRYDQSGRQVPGAVIDLEYAKFYLENICKKAGVSVLYHTTAAHLQMRGKNIDSVMLSTEAGNYAARAKVYIDATGNGNVAVLAGCTYEIGHPQTGKTQPGSMSVIVSGLKTISNTDNLQHKRGLKKTLEEEYGITVSAEGVTVFKGAGPDTLLMSFNNQYDISPDDIFSLSSATTEGRLECFRVLEGIKKIPGNENMTVHSVSARIGIREGRRINGVYKLTLEDIVSGARFKDAICKTKFYIDVHPTSANDRENHTGGLSVKPYHIPYRSLVAADCDNLILAGRCISGDFYAHASYRVAGNVIPMGEAAGFAAAECAKKSILPSAVDGTDVSAYMASLGYEI